MTLRKSNEQDQRTFLFYKKPAKPMKKKQAKALLLSTVFALLSARAQSFDSQLKAAKPLDLGENIS
jgi:hypothetical protein